MKELISRLVNQENCKLIEKVSHEDVLSHILLPDDVKEFYSYCDGAILFEGLDYQLKIVEPSEIKLANPIIVGELCEEDISSKWYIIAKDMNGDYITIDSRKERFGYCYDSHWERHGVPGECAIIAKSFSEMVARLLETNGKYCYWLSNDFVTLGDAYDDFES